MPRRLCAASAAELRSFAAKGEGADSTLPFMGRVGSPEQPRDPHHRPLAFARQLRPRASWPRPPRRVRSKRMSEAPAPDRVPVIRVIAMPADTNAEGDIFGGWLMSQMDLAAGTLAYHTSKGRAATVAMDGMIFHRPVKVGDEVSVYAELTAVGRTSMTIYVEAWRRARAADLSQKVTEARFTFVALDGDGRPRPVR